MAMDLTVVQVGRLETRGCVPGHAACVGWSWGIRISASFLARAHTYPYSLLYVGNLETSILTSEILVSFCSAVLDQPALTSLNGSVLKVEVSCVREMESGRAEPS